MEFGCTPQDVWADLGAPGGITYKNVDTMVIHAKQEMCTSGANSTAGAAGVGGGGASSRDYFYNYYRLGLDVLFDGHLHEAKKFVLHTNAVGHVDFNTYLKCNFVVRRGAWPGEEEQVRCAQRGLGRSVWASGCARANECMCSTESLARRILAFHVNSMIRGVALIGAQVRRFASFQVLSHAGFLTRLVANLFCIQ